MRPLTDEEVLELLTRTQAAEMLGIHVNTLDRLIARREIEVYKLGQLVRIHPREITRVLNANSSLRRKQSSRRPASRA